MEGHGLVIAAPHKRRGKNVLPGVLLHLVEAVRPVDRARDARAFRVAIEHVGDGFAFIDDIEDWNAGDRSMVRGLSARVRIKRRAVEIDANTISLWRSAQNIRLKLAQVTVAVVEPFGFQDSPPTFAGFEWGRFAKRPYNFATASIDSTYLYPLAVKNTTIVSKPAM